MKEKTISTDALAILSNCSQDGQLVRIHGQLARTLYEEVDYVLRAIGGKWNRKLKAHLFSEPEKDVAEMLEGCIQCGIAVPLRPGSFFPTPPELGKKMVELAKMETGNSILEPSAGDGQLATVILLHMPLGCRLKCIELDEKLYRKLSAFNVPGSVVHAINADFLTTMVCYDRVIMNPPFQKLQDVNHITHAWKCLKPGGRIVSVASQSVAFRMEYKAKLFRELVSQFGKITPLPQNTFKDSGTLVNTVLVTLTKEATQNKE